VIAARVPGFSKQHDPSGGGGQPLTAHHFLWSAAAAFLYRGLIMASVALGYSQITGINSAAKGLADGSGGAIPTGTTYTLIQAEAQSIRWRDDGTDPDANTGELLAPGSTITYSGKLTAFKVIAAANGAKVNISFYRS
jgi:hypothetical protein